MTTSFYTPSLTNAPKSSTPVPSPLGLHAKPMRKRKEAGDYWLGRTLGKGSSGRVKLGYHKKTGEKVAVKIISKTYLTSNATTERAVKREIAVMKLIQHPHIVGLIDVIDVPDSSNLYLILEYVQGGELFEYLITKGRLSEKDARKHFQQIIFGMDFCHRHLICHRDLKPENLLLDDALNIKIADFGMASLQPSGTLLETSCGSPHYASPEIVTGIPYNGTASDTWSCGVILYALVCGHLPFDDNNIRELLQKVKRGKYELPDFLSDLAKDLIQKILVVDPDKRLTMQQIQEHGWFNIDGRPLNSTLTPHLSGTDEIAKPIKDTSSIDERLLESLQDLWVGSSQKQLIDALMSRVYNMEKVAYNLLQRHSSNYWRQQDDLGDPKRTPRQRRRPITICGPPTSLKSPLSRNTENEIDRILPPPSPGVQRQRLAIQRKHVNPDLLKRPLQSVTIQRESSNRHGSRMCQTMQRSLQEEMARVYIVPSPKQPLRPPSHPLMCSGSPLLLASKALTASSSPRLEAPTIDSPKLTSWLPGLSHFKRPKIYAIQCIAKDEKEAYGKLAQVIRERMNGSYTEEKDHHGILRRKGQFEAGQGKVRFKLELGHGPAITISIIQQQGDTTTFLDSIAQMEKALDDYEKDAAFISSANGWNIYKP